MDGKGHVPIRSCLVCGVKSPKCQLRRLALDGPEPLIVADGRQRLGGRGAYVCPECLPRLTFNKKVQRAFRGRAKGLAQQPGPSVS